MDQPREEGSGRQHDGVSLEANAELGDDAGHARVRAVAIEREIVDGLLEDREMGRVLEAPADRLAIEDAIGLRPGRADRGPLARIENPELDPGLIGRKRHRAAQRIHFLHQVTLADPSDRGIAGHLPQCLDVMSEKQGRPAHPRAGECGLRPGMAAPDDNDLEASWEQHDFKRY